MVRKGSCQNWRMNLFFKNNEVHLILLAKSLNFYKVSDKVVIHNLGFENRGKLQKLNSEIRTFYKLRKLFIKEMPDTCLSFMEKYNIFTILASRKLKLKIFISDRSNPKKRIPFFINYLRIYMYRYATGIVAQTNLAKEILETSTQNKNIQVIPNPVRTVLKYPNIKREKIILNVGRLITEKGQKYLIEAFSKLNEPEWKLIILGEGALRQDLESQIEAYNLKDQVIMPGTVSNVDEWLARASIFCFPSVSEGFPNALIEAMAAGLACLSFNCDAGPNEIIDHDKNGLLIPVKDVETLFEQLSFLCNDNEKRLKLGLKAIEIREFLNSNKIANNYLDFFSSTTQVN